MDRSSHLNNMHLNITDSHECEYVMLDSDRQANYILASIHTAMNQTAVNKCTTIKPPSDEKKSFTSANLKHTFADVFERLK